MKSWIKKVLKRFNLQINPYGAIPITARQLENFETVSYFYKHILHLRGDVVECGVGKGRTFLYLSFLIARDKMERALWGFDSFEGFPEPTVEDVSDRKPKRGDWSGTSMKDILVSLKVAGISSRFIDGQVKLVQGFFSDTLTQYSGEIALLHVDADLYESYRDVLNNLYGKVVSGGIIFFDEYGESAWPGAKKAVDEFCSEHSLHLEKSPEASKYYIVKP